MSAVLTYAVTSPDRAAPDTPTADALKMLASWAATQELAAHEREGA